jgi:cell division protease FtsH
MVAHYGMSERVGPTYHDHRAEHPFLGRRVAADGGTSDATIHVVEQETRRLLDDARRVASDTIAQQRPALDRLVAALLETETLERDELDRLLGPSEPADRDGALDLVPAAPSHPQLVR